jgi:hypothetical protein
VDDLTSAVVTGADELLRAGASVPPITVQMFCADLDRPYVGFVSCRPFQRGRDAANAVGVLCRLPSVLAVTLVVVVWEYAELRFVHLGDGWDRHDRSSWPSV